MTTERLQPDAMAAALFPCVELIAHEADLLPETANDTRGALRRDLDHRRHDFEHAAVEVDRATGRKLQRLRRSFQQRLFDERRRFSPDVFGRDADVIDEDCEL